MTCIAAMIEDGRVVMGGDSAGVGGWGVTIRQDSKVFCQGLYTIGFTSSFRMGDVLRYIVKFPAPPKKNLRGFMVKKFIPEIRKVFKAEGVSKIVNNEDTCGQFLVGVRAHIFCVGSDYQVGEAMEPFNACGSGECEARAVMHTLSKHLNYSAEHCVERALEAAAHYNMGVRGPFKIIRGK